MEKKEVLKYHLIENEGFTPDEVEEVTETLWESFEVCGREYAVFTDEEADYATQSNILDSLWAFRPHFILRHTEFYGTSSVEDDEAFEEAIGELQTRLCERANPIIRALIRNLDTFVRDAIDSDGRGHFIGLYDGEEHEVGNYYIYRIN